MMRAASLACAMAMAPGLAAEAAVADRAVIKFEGHGQGTSWYNGYPSYAGLKGSVEFLYDEAKERYYFDDVIAANIWGYVGGIDINYTYDKSNQKYWDIDVFEFNIDLVDYKKSGSPTEIIGGVGYFGGSYIVSMSFDGPSFYGTDYNHTHVTSNYGWVSYEGAGYIPTIPLPASFWLLTAALSAAGLVRSRHAG